MSDSEFITVEPTAGPWDVDDTNTFMGRIFISAPDPKPNNHMLGRLEAWVVSDDIDSDVARANAYLIVKAPDLKDLLLECVEHIESLTASGDSITDDIVLRAHALLESTVYTRERNEDDEIEDQSETGGSL